MRKHVKKILVLVALLTLLQGCSALGVKAPEDPIDRWALAADSFSIAMETSSELYKADVIGLEELVYVQQAGIVARSALDAWKITLEKDRDPEAAKDRFEDAMSEINDVILTQEGK